MLKNERPIAIVVTETAGSLSEDVQAVELIQKSFFPPFEDYHGPLIVRFGPNGRIDLNTH